MRHKLLTEAQSDWLKEQLRGKGIIFASIHGSWLYGLQREGSDIDVKAVYAPSKIDLLLGDGNKTFNKKNDELDIEVEIKSLPSFLKSCKSCDTNCIDLLHTPDNMILHTTGVWEDIKGHRTNLYAKNMKGLVGYIKTHTHKYNNKIERYDEMRELLGELSFIKDECKLKNSTIPKFITRREFRFIKNISVKSDHEQHYIEVCGKKYILTWEAKLLKDALKTEISRYGKRTNAGSGKGMDAKSLSHSLRVLFQVKQIVTEKTITFPLKEAPYLLDVKVGKITDVDEVMSRITEEYDVCMELIEKCDLPDEVDINPMLNALTRIYFD